MFNIIVANNKKNVDLYKPINTDGPRPQISLHVKWSTSDSQVSTWAPNTCLEYYSVHSSLVTLNSLAGEKLGGSVKIVWSEW